MKTLAIETSSAIGGVAAWGDGRVLAERLFTERMNHAQELFPALQAMNAELGWGPKSPELIAVSVGPGSYTGLRVGIAAAKMLSYAIGARLIGVPTFDVLVRNVPASARAATPVVDAKRGQVYLSLYEWGDGAWGRALPLGVDEPAAAAGCLPQGVTIFGTGAEKYRDVFEAAGAKVCADAALTQPKPGVVAELGAALHQSGARTDRDSLVPIYLRKPEAEEKREARQA